LFVFTTMVLDIRLRSHIYNRFFDMICVEIGVFKEAHKIILSCFFEGKNCIAVEKKVYMKDKLNE